MKRPANPSEPAKHAAAPKARIEMGWSYEEAEEAALALERLLTNHGIRILPGSAFERHVLSVLHLVDQKRSRSVSPEEENFRDRYRTLVGVHELANLILAAKDSPSFQAILPHLRLLNEGQALQNMPSGGTDQATNKLFELFMATVVLQCGQDLLLDDPIASRGDNPDVLVNIGGRRWGIACKVLHGLSPQGFIDNLIKGLDQIDCSSAEVGVVAFNMKNVLPHNEIWPLAPVDGVLGNPLAPGVWSNFNDPFQLLVYRLQVLGKDLVSYLPAGYIDNVFASRKSIPGILLWGHSVTAVLVDGKPTPTSVRVLNFQTAGHVSAEDYRVMECLNWAVYLDSPTRGPNPLSEAATPGN